MSLVNVKCYYCEEPVQVKSEKDAWICPACGEPFIVEKAIRLSKKENIKENILKKRVRMVVNSNTV